MKLRLVCAIALSVSWTGIALAQSGVSNQRDMYGNLVRDAGTASPRALNQGPKNNGGINNAPTQPPAGNARSTNIGNGPNIGNGR
jgi:hypothetical protein